VSDIEDSLLVHLWVLAKSFCWMALLLISDWFQ